MRQLLSQHQVHVVIRVLTRAILPLLCAFVIIMVFLYADLSTIEQWLTTHHTHLWLWRLGLLIIVFISWPMLVRYRTRHLALDNDTLRKLIQRRYWVVLALWLIDMGIHSLTPSIT